MKASELYQPELPFGLEELSPYELVKKMHEKFGIDYAGEPRHLDPEEKAFRVKCLKEEINEYESAVSRSDELDALIDLMVFALGSLERHGYPFLAPFREGMYANLKKELAGEASKSKRNFAIDLIKPEGWQAADVGQFIGEEK